jgi:DNA polymerase III subunit delta'
MFFNDIEGHEGPLQILKRALAHGTLAHAYLFSGESGIGKKMTALGLAAAVNCGAAGPDGGCGSCPSCRKVASGGHPDVRLLAAEGNEIKIDQVREAQADLALRPFEGNKKVLIVDGAEGLNAASANAFLKTLEEPPGDALIILITAMPQSLLPTIRSRCQEIVFHLLPRHILAAALMRKRGLPEDDAWFLAALAQGSLGRGIEMDVEAEKALRDEVLTLWSGLGRLSPGETLLQAEAYGKDRERLERLLDIGIEWLRDAVVYRETSEERLLVNGGRRDLLRQWCERRPLPGMFLDLDLFISSRKLLDRRVSAQLVAENLLLKLGRA